jgi:ArsR family transcriptional regulator
MMESTLRTIRLLTDPLRLRIMLLLEREELSVAELQHILSTGQSSISMHLAQLKQAGLVEVRRAGKNGFYRSTVAADGLPEGVGEVLEVLRAPASAQADAQADRQALDLVLEHRQDRVRAYFDELAGRFGREYVPGRSWQAVAELLMKLMPPMVIADLGAGEATLSLMMAERAEKVIAVDSAPRMVKYGADVAAERGVPNFEYRLGDLEALPIEDASVDLVTLTQSLHHAQHPRKAVAEAHRILKPGGRVAILDLLRHDFEEAHELYADLWLGFTEVQVRRYLRDAGFQEIETALLHREPEPPHFETLLALGRR